MRVVSTIKKNLINYLLRGNKMFTRQHYKAIAEIIKTGTYEDRSSYKVIDIELLTGNLADYFAQDKPRFDRQKFLDACGI